MKEHKKRILILKQADRYRLTELFVTVKMLTDYMGVHDAVFTHNSARISDNHFATHPEGVLVVDLKRSDLVSLPYDVIPDFGACAEADFALPSYQAHANIYQKTDANFFIHCHDSAVIAVANDPEGIKRTCQQSLCLNDIVYHKKYTGIADLPLSEEFSDEYNNNNKSVFLLQGHGAIILAKTVNELILHSYMLVMACRVQALNDTVISWGLSPFTPGVKNVLGGRLYKSFYHKYAEHLESCCETMELTAIVYDE